MRQDKYRGNVFVANLPAGYTDEQLAAAFDDFGLVLSAFLARDAETGAPKTHGLVSIAPDTAAAAAIAALNGSKIGNKQIEVRRADPEMALSIPRAARQRPPRPYSSHDEGPRERHHDAGAHPPRAYSTPDNATRPPVIVERVRPRRWS